tara:strand:- start:7091 stop:7327 length:237 start_codon:yes stop_codon:yes gene_type:complete
MTIRTIESDVSFEELIEKLKTLDGVKNMKVYEREEWLGKDVDVSQLPPNVRRMRLRELNRTAKPIPNNVIALGQKNPK